MQCRDGRQRSVKWFQWQKAPVRANMDVTNNKSNLTPAKRRIFHLKCFHGVIGGAPQCREWSAYCPSVLIMPSGLEWSGGSFLDAELSSSGWWKMENPHTEALPRDRRPGYSAGYISDAETGAFHFGD
jgi:hypothetical protein